MKKLIATAVTITTVTWASSAFAAPFTNGDFETGDLTGWELTCGTAADEATVVNSPDVMDNYYAKLNDSDSSGIASIYQTFDINPLATTVDVSFDYYFTGQDDTNWYSDVIFSTFAFKSGDNCTGFFDILDWELTTVSTTSPRGYFETKATYSASYDVSLVDESPNAVLQFGIWEASAWCWRDKTDSWLGVDNISVSSNASPVPEPATMLLFGTGLAGLATASRKRKKQA